MKRKIVKIILAFLGILVLFFGGIIIFLSVTEYKPEKIEELTKIEGSKSLKLEDSFSVMTFNIGYAGLGKDQDFFMDGGKMVRPEQKENVEENLKGIEQVFQRENPDFLLLQELDINSKRSYNINEKESVEAKLKKDGVFAPNFVCEYVPFPLPTIGKVESGVATFSQYSSEKATRISLPVSFKWPVRMANLKRCLLKTRFPIVGTDKELVIFNAHLEAYDDGEGKKEQTKIMLEVMEEEYEKGNYVIAGGDFNQSLAENLNKYPIKDEKNWIPGVLEPKDFGENFSMQMDHEVPTCRLNDSLLHKNTQTYVVDGFLVSNNIIVEEVKTLDEGFVYSDHNPVRLKFSFKE